MLHDKGLLPDITDFLGEGFVKGTAQHLVDDLLGGRLGGDGSGIHDLAVSHHGVGVADPQHLLDAVGDEDDCDIFGLPQVAHHPEQLLGFGVGQGGGGLVEDQEVTGVLNRPGDQHHLLLGQSQAAAGAADVDVHVEPLQHFRGLFADSAVVHEELALHIHDRVVEHDVLCHRQGGDQSHVHLLVHDLDAELLGVGGVAYLDDLPVVEHVAGIGRVGAGQHLHQGGFAGAVGAHDSVDHAGADLEITVGQGLDAGKLNGNLFGS